MKPTFFKKLDRFWFPPEPPSSLAVCRVIFFSWLFCWYWTYDFTAIAFHPPEIWRPIGLLRRLGLDAMPSVETIAWLQTTWKASLFLAAIGLATRGSMVVAWGLGAYLLGLTHSFNKVNHSDGALILAMLVFVMTRAGDVLSVDNLLCQIRGRGANRPPSPAILTGEYGWPLQMMRLILVLTFFGAGVSKVVVGGIDWMLSDSMYTILSYVQLTRDPPLELTLAPEYLIPFGKTMAVGTVVLELSTPLALISRVGRAIIIPGLLCMQIGIRLVMGDNFTQFMALYLFWVPWSAIGAFCLAHVRNLGRSGEELPQRSASSATLSDN